MRFEEVSFEVGDGVLDVWRGVAESGARFDVQFGVVGGLAVGVGRGVVLEVVGSADILSEAVEGTVRARG